MKNLTYIHRFIFLACIVLLSACSNDDDDDDVVTAAKVAIINGISDAPGLILSFQGDLSNAASFGQSSDSFSTLEFDSYEVDILFTDSEGVLNYLFEDLVVNISSSDEIYILLTGSLATPSVSFIENPIFELEEDEDGNVIASDEVRLQFVNATNFDVPVDIYFSEFETPLIDVVPVTTFSGGVTQLQSLTADDDFRIRVTEQSDATVIYDSGEIALNAVRNQIFLLVDYFGPGDHQLKVVSIANQITTQLINEDLEAELRVANFITKQGDISLYLDDVDDDPEFANVTFRSFSDYVTLEPETYAVNVTPTTSNLNFLFENTETLIAGESRTLYLAGNLDTDEGISGRYVLEDKRVVATEINLNFVNAASSAAEVDVYVLSPGQPFSDALPQVVGAGLLSSSLIPVSAGSYDLIATLAGQDTTIAGPSRIQIDSGSFSIVLSDSALGEAPYALLLFKEGVFVQ